MTQERTSTQMFVARLRATANVALLIGAIILLISFAAHWPPEIIAPIGLLTILAFLVSFFAILIENRLTPEDEGQA